MPEGRGRKGSSEDLLPREGVRAWAEVTWAVRAEVAKLSGGAWLLREAAKVLGLPEEAVDEALHR